MENPRRIDWDDMWLTDALPRRSTSPPAFGSNRFRATFVTSS